MAEPMRPEDVPPALKAIVDRAAGKEHSAEGPVMACLAEVLTAHEAMVLARIEALADDEPEPEIDEDSCRLVDIDGETVRVRGSYEMDEQDQQALGEVFRAARARMKAEKEAERAELEHQVRAQVAEEITELLRAAPDHPTAYLRLANFLGDARDAARGEGG